MAHSKLYMKNPVTGSRRAAPIGFSWTSFFFGPIPCIFRQDWLTTIVVVIMSIVLAFLGLSFVLWLLQGFFYNKYYVEKLVNEGYQVEHWEGRSMQELRTITGLNLTSMNHEQPAQ